jgi:hypothetical protein
VDDDPHHVDRCWLDVAEKRTRRDVGDGRIGLSKGSVAA